MLCEVAVTEAVIALVIAVSDCYTNGVAADLEALVTATNDSQCKLGFTEVAVASDTTA
jgi:hypothetical protein